jgi:DNA-directed RNA polymerase specialized sigma24 family protein
MWRHRLNRLSDKQREEIRVLRSDGQTLDEIAKRFNTSVGTVYRIVMPAKEKAQRTAKCSN